MQDILIQFILTKILREIVENLNRNNNTVMASGHVAINSPEQIFTNEIRTRLELWNLVTISKKFKAGQERWQSPNQLNHNLNGRSSYILYENGFEPDIIIKCQDYSLIEIKKINNRNNYPFIFTGNHNMLVSNNWGTDAIFSNNNQNFLTYHKEGKLWQDAMRLINFASPSDQSFMLGFVDNTSNHQQISTKDFRDRLHYIMIDILQNKLLNSQFNDGRERVFSQFTSNPNQPVYTFLPPKSYHPIWISWVNSNGFQDGVYPPPKPGTTPKLIAYLFEIKM